MKPNDYREPFNFKNTFLDYLFKCLNSYHPTSQKQTEEDTVPKKITAYLNTSRSGEDYHQDYRAVRSGGYYILEIVRPDTREARDHYALDGTRNVNGVSRIVSKQRMYVDTVISTGTSLKLYCRGMDNFGKRADGWYIFYQTPDSLNRRDTFVLSITSCY